MEASKEETCIQAVQETGACTSQPTKTSVISKYWGLAMLAMIITALQYNSFSSNRSCAEDISDGYWSGKGDWFSYHCVHYDYSRTELKKCLMLKPKVVLFGENDDVEKFSTVIEEEITSPIVLSMVIQSELSSVTQDYQALSKDIQSDTSSLVIQKLSSSTIKDCKETIPKLVHAQQDLLKAINGDQTSGSSVLIAVLSPKIPPRGSIDFSNTACEEYIENIYSNITSPLLHYIKTPPTIDYVTPSDVQSLPIELVFILNLFCNSPLNASCCIPPSTFTSFITYLATCFIISILAIYMGVWLIFVSGATFALTPHLETLSFDIDKFFSFLHAVGGVTAVLFYMLLADRLNYFTRADAQESLSLFLILIVIVVMVTITTISPSKSHKEMLSHDLCNEWRGWMVLFMICTHYTGVSELTMICLINELIVGAFLFLTGYTHFLHYWKSGTIAWSRVLKVLLQMNFLCLCVCLCLGSSYGSYYLVVILSGWYLVVVSFTVFWPSLTPGRLKRYTSPRVMVLIKFVIAFVLLALLRFTKEFWLDLLSLGPMKMVFESFDGQSDELFYWFYQQRYTAFSGMTFAYITLTVGGTFRSALSRYENQLKIVGALVSFLILMGYVMFLYTCDNKLECSSMQSYMGILPILAYIFLRNGNLLHNHFSAFLQEAGSNSLWLFVSHFHILRAFNGNGQLVLFPRLYYFNIAAVVAVFIYLYTTVITCVDVLKKWLLGKVEPKDTVPDDSIV